MSAKLNLSIGIGTLAVMLIMSLSVLYFTNLGIQQGEQRSKDIKEVREDFKQFKQEFQDRQVVGNARANITLNEIRQVERDVLGNLTHHRQVTNQTFDKVVELLNQTQSLTGPEYEKLADKKVDNIVNWIIGNLTKNNINDSNLFGDVIGDASKGEDQ